MCEGVTHFVLDVFKCAAISVDMRRCSMHDGQRRLLIQAELDQLPADQNEGRHQEARIRLPEALKTSRYGEADDLTTRILLEGAQGSREGSLRIRLDS
jgi:hypothetical protein